MHAFMRETDEGLTLKQVFKLISYNIENRPCTYKEKKKEIGPQNRDSRREKRSRFLPGLRHRFGFDNI